MRRLRGRLGARTDDDLLLTGTCQISVADRPPGDPNLFARSVLDAHPDGGTSLQKGIIELPAGIAAVVVSDAVVPVPGAFFGVPTDGAAEVLSVSFQMAFPRTPQAVAVILSTEELGAQEEFLELATVVVEAVSPSVPHSIRAPWPWRTPQPQRRLSDEQQHRKATPGTNGSRV